MSERRKRESSAPPMLLSTPTKPKVSKLTPVPVPGKAPPPPVYVPRWNGGRGNVDMRGGRPQFIRSMTPAPEFSVAGPSNPFLGRGETSEPNFDGIKSSGSGFGSSDLLSSVYDDFDSKNFQSSPPILGATTFSALQPYKSSPIVSSSGQLIKGILKTPEKRGHSPGSSGGGHSSNKKRKTKSKKRVTIDPMF